MSYPFILKDIQKKTGLNERFLRRCLVDMRDVFEPHIGRGENNALLFDESALVLFDKIKQLKAGGLNIPEIRKRLGYRPGKPEKEGGETGSQTLVGFSEKPVKPDEETSVSRFYERLLEEKEKTHQAELEAKSYQLQMESKELEMKALKIQLYLLTDGRDPEEVKREEEEKRKKKKEILDRLEELEGRWFKGEERRKLLEELRRLS